MNDSAKRPLYIYVIATAIVWAVLLGAIRLRDSPAHFMSAFAVCAGFFLGMLVMYIAVHIYRWK